MPDQKHEIFPYQAKIYHLDFLLRSQHWSSDRLKKLQLEGFRALINFAKENCSYYKDLPNVRSLDDIKDFPILTKSDINQNFNDILTKEIPHRLIETGGTISKIKVARDVLISQMRAGLSRFESWYRLGLLSYKPLPCEPYLQYQSLSTRGRDCHYKIAHLWGSIEGKDFNWSGNRLWLPVEKLTNITVAEKYLKALDKMKPHLLHGYALPLTILARYAVELHIRPTIKVIRSECETLTSTMREDIRKGFRTHGCIYNLYGSRELGEMAQDCEKHNNLHIFPERYIIEVVDGRFVITDLMNYAFPLIRYENQDVGEFGGVCECGRGLPTIKPLVGRVLNYLKTKSGNWVTGFIVYLPIMYYDKKHGTNIFNWVEAYQVKQREEGKITVLLKPWNHIPPPENLSSVLEVIQKFVSPEDFDVDIKIVDKIPKSSSGKQLSIDTTLKRQW